MGMSTAEYLAQVETGRFRILGTKDVQRVLPDAMPNHFDIDEWGWWLVEFDAAGKAVRIVGSDGGEPEDQLLVRNWSWVAKEMNALAAERANLVDPIALLEVAGEHVYSDKGNAFGLSDVNAWACWCSCGKWSGSYREPARAGHRAHVLAEFRARVGAGGVK
jgi:hypothetical protein